MRGQASTRKRTIRPWPTSRSGRRTGEVPDGRAADAGDRGLHLRRRRTAGVVPAERSDCGAHSCPPSPYLPPPPPAPPRTPAGGNPAGRAGRGRTAPLMTPGAAFAVGKARICVAGYSASVRNVPQAEATAVYDRYGVAHDPYAHEVDHLVSLEIGGSNAIANQWPEPYAGRWGAHTK